MMYDGFLRTCEKYFSMVPKKECETEQKRENFLICTDSIIVGQPERTLLRQMEQVLRDFPCMMGVAVLVRRLSLQYQKCKCTTDLR